MIVLIPYQLMFLRLPHKYDFIFFPFVGRELWTVGSSEFKN